MVLIGLNSVDVQPPICSLNGLKLTLLVGMHPYTGFSFFLDTSIKRSAFLWSRKNTKSAYSCYLL